MAYSNKSVVNLWILVFHGLVFFYFKPCVSIPVSTVRLAAFTKTVKRYSMAAGVYNTLIGTYSRSRSVNAISLLEQEMLEEAKESLAQTALTLSVLDIGGGVGGGIASPIIEKIIGKVFSKASKWLKGASVFDVLGPLTDTLTIGLNIWGLDIAIRDNNPEGIAAASLSIAAGVVGLSTFIAAVATGTAGLGPIGALAGAILGITATLIELVADPGYDTAAVEAYKARLGQLRTLRDASKDRIDWRMEILEKMPSQYSDVYVNNQAACIADYGYLLKMKDPKTASESIFHQTNSQSSFYQRGFVGSKPLGISEAQEEIDNGQYVCIGDYNFIPSPIMPCDPPFSGLCKTLGWVGFDFYGQFKEDTEYGGVRVFLDSDFGISNFELRGVDIDTANYSISGTVSSTHQNDVIIIGDYKNLQKKTGNLLHEILVKTRYGNDSLNINGMIGKFESSYENRLTADLGEGKNVLSLKGITRNRTDRKGVFFDSRTGVVKYYHGQNGNTHTLGTVKNVAFFIGSPFDDHWQFVVSCPLMYIGDLTGESVLTFFNICTIGRSEKGGVIRKHVQPRMDM
ncbi:hypothetical protein ACROYT_G030226 [Oculina patagonica]